MNYSKMTDSEINCEVLAVIEPDVAHMQLSHEQKSFYHCGFDGNGFYETVIPDYCNSWDDAGPIIQSNYISIECDDMFDEPTPQSYWKAHNPRGNHYTDQNPLRAAMIVFLTMKETK